MSRPSVCVLRALCGSVWLAVSLSNCSCMSVKKWGAKRVDVHETQVKTGPPEFNDSSCFMYELQVQLYMVRRKTQTLYDSHVQWSPLGTLVSVLPTVTSFFAMFFQLEHASCRHYHLHRGNGCKHLQVPLSRCVRSGSSRGPQ